MLILKEAIAAIRRTPMMTVLTALVIAVTLAVIGRVPRKSTYRSIL
jgi:cell division protein FtsX